MSLNKVICPFLCMWAEDVKRDAKWSSQKAQKRQMLVSFNKVIHLLLYIRVCVYIHKNVCVCAKWSSQRVQKRQMLVSFCKVMSLVERHSFD
jgi:hypothetical protein